MADRDFALPIGNDETTLSTVQVQIGKPYLQPVAIDNYHDNYSSGLEIWLPDSVNDRKVYASFNGLVRYIAADATTSFNQIELTINDLTVRIINRISGLLEPAPKKVIYKNVEEEGVKNDMQLLINNAYQSALNNTNQNSWHPVMRIKYQNQIIKTYLDNHSTDISAAIGVIVDDFIAGNFSLLLNSGDLLGDADVYTNIFDQISDGVTFTDPRCMVFEMFEYAGNNISPKYYYWRLLKNAYHQQQNRRLLTLITETTLNNGEFNHPFLIALSVNLNENVNPKVAIAMILPGQQTETLNVYLFPIGKLSTWDGTNVNGSDPSDLQWRISDDDNPNFEIRRRPGLSVPTVRLCGEATGSVNVCVDVESTTIPQNERTNIINRVETMWTDYGDDITDICAKLQVPAEIIISIMGHETQGRARAVRFEPLNESQKNELYNNPNIADSTVNAYVEFTTSNYVTPPVPVNPADWNNPIQPQASTLTWNQAKEVAALMPHRCSPGLMQTLISTAASRYEWLDRWFGDMAQEFDIDPLPADNAQRFDWLLTARHAILAGAAVVKYNYCNMNTKWNLELIYTAYNAGSIRYSNNIWGTVFYHQHYPVDAGRHFNAFQNYIQNEACRIRFWRNVEPNNQ